MKDYNASSIINLALIGHSHEGKTTLAEAMLFTAGITDRMGSTDSGNSFMDFEPEEIKHKISVSTSIAHINWKDKKINLLDTPGFHDFGAEVVSALYVCSCAAIVISATSDIPVGTEIAWQRCVQAKVPRCFIVTKLDKENANFNNCVSRLQETFTPKPVLMQYPIGATNSLQGIIDIVNLKAFSYDQKGNAKEIDIPSSILEDVNNARMQLVEAAAENDDEILEKYLEGQELTVEEIVKGIRIGIANGKLVPIFVTSALKLFGISTLFDVITEFMPSSSNKALATVDGKTLMTDSGYDICAFIFKTNADQFVGRINYFYVVTGTLQPDTSVYNSNQNADEKIAQLFIPKGKTLEPVQKLSAGDIGAVTKLEKTKTSDTLCSKTNIIQIKPIEFPLHAYTMAIMPKTRADEDKIAGALSKAAEEDPSLVVEYNSVTKQTTISGLGDMHLEVTIEKLKRKYGVDTYLEAPRIPYQETIRSSAKAEGRYVKQSGGRGQYGVCVIEIAPTANGEEYQWEDKIFGGAIPQNFRPAVEKGVREAMDEGVIAGYPLKYIKVTLVDGKYHPVDSSDMAFKIAGAMALRKAALEANPYILEPIMEVHIFLPERFTGDVISAITGCRGKPGSMQAQTDGWGEIVAYVPLAEMRKLSLDLRSITQGRAYYAMSLHRYEELPNHLAQVLIDEYQKKLHSA
jgi:elongation factor G